MSIPKIASALGYIDEELICRAVDFSPDYRKSFRFSWKYAVALAACFCVAVIIAISPNSRLQENTGVDVEPCVHLSLQEAQSDPVFGQYVPAVIAEGFELESTVNVYELLRAEVFLYFDIAGTPVTARLEPTTKARFGDKIRIAFEEDKIHVFDKETEEVITN